MQVWQTANKKYLTKGTNEYLAGIEFDVTKQLTLSCGGQITDYGLSDNYQSDTSFSCDSYSLGVGAKIKDEQTPQFKCWLYVD